MTADVARDLATAGGMADMDGVSQVELLDELGQIIGIGVHVVAGPRLARPAVTATVMGNAEISVRGQEEHLVLECVGTERPSMAEDDGLTRAPVIVVDLGTVLRRDRCHGALPFRLVMSVSKSARPLFGGNG